MPVPLPADTNAVAPLYELVSELHEMNGRISGDLQSQAERLTRVETGIVRSNELLSVLVELGKRDDARKESALMATTQRRATLVKDAIVPISAAVVSAVAAYVAATFGGSP
jgi:hypothetical protein